jgi:D-ribose pyranase
MKKTGIFNKDISEVIASLGHNQTLAIVDAGYPIPGSVRRIDLSLVAGVPGFIETLKAVLLEMKVDHTIVARETAKISPQIKAQLDDLLGDVPSEVVSHEELKKISGSSVAIIRTGECTPYANIILVSGVIF